MTTPLKEALNALTDALAKRPARPLIAFAFAIDRCLRIH
jgi:hypothetical protein